MFCNSFPPPSERDVERRRPNNFIYLYFNLQEFDGNVDRNSVSANKLPHVIDVDRVRFHPVAWYRGICMRVELIGCVKGIQKLLELCMYDYLYMMNCAALVNSKLVILV